MKVRCINDAGWTEKRKFLFFGTYEKRVDGPKKEDILTVIDEHWEDGKLWYRLKEWPTEKGDGWQADCFVPVEPEFEKIEFEKIVEKEPVSLN